MDKTEGSIAEAMFHVEGDNVYFRGLDVEKLWEGYECPLFDSWISSTVARYVSTPERRIFRDDGSGLYIISVKSEQRQYILPTYEYHGKRYVDFGGTAPWKKEVR